MELHVPDTTHGLDLGLEGAEVVVVSVVTALKQVLVASVSRVLVTHPPEGDMQRAEWVSITLISEFRLTSLCVFNFNSIFIGCLCADVLGMDWCPFRGPLGGSSCH